MIPEKSKRYLMDFIQEHFTAALQAFAVLQLLFTIILLPFVVSFGTIYLLFTPLCVPVVCYLAWMVLYDWKTTSRGGRLCTWVQNFPVWRWLADYFPVNLHKTADLDPKQHYLIGSHPHGILPMGAFVNFNTNATQFKTRFPGIKPRLLTLKSNFCWPFSRQYVMSTGLCDVSKDSCNWLLRKSPPGTAAVIAVGGAEESLLTQPGTHTLILSKRKGFIRMAIKSGARLVPSYSFGENNIYTQVDNSEGSLIRRFQERCKRAIGFTVPIFYGRMPYDILPFGPLPFRAQIDTVIGEPIDVGHNENPTNEEVDIAHSHYVEALTSLFDHYKTRFGISEDLKLVIL